MALENTTSPLPKVNLLHAHRLENTKSKLPAFRFADLKSRIRVSHGVAPSILPKETVLASTTTQGTEPNATTNPTAQQIFLLTGRPASPTASPVEATEGSAATRSPSSQPKSTKSRPRLRRQPASCSSNGIDTQTGPPPALSTQRSFAADPAQSPVSHTSEWASAQRQLAIESHNNFNSTRDDIAKTANETTKPLRAASRSLDESKLSRPVIPPIRSFRSSAARKSLDMYPSASQHYEEQSDGVDDDRNCTLRALEGLSNEDRFSRQSSFHAQARDESSVEANSEDLFLSLAQDGMSRQAGNGDIRDSMSRTERRRSRIALASNRQSLPAISYKSSSLQMPGHGSELQPSFGEEDSSNRHQIAYRPPSRDRPTGLPAPQPGDLSKTKFAARSSPITPRSPLTLESPSSYGRRRPSIPDSSEINPARTHAYRKSILSHTTPRTYHSSPLVARSMDVDDAIEPRRVAEGTESTASTTAPSTVWDELDDLKSRIRKLELTGKLPATSGAAVSHATGDRPPTATTTITTLSTSPKRGRRLSFSPSESMAGGSATNETHPLLHSALAKTQPALTLEVYKALEATTSDALSLVAMMGSVGQPGPISSTQSALGATNGAAGITDRQLRRKADSMCRNLTELCLALSEPKAEPLLQAAPEALSQPGSREVERPVEPQNHIINGAGDNLSHMKPSPRPMSRLEARRSSLLNGSSLPSPRYTPPTSGESTTPTQNSVGNRRTSLYRTRHAGGDEWEDDEEAIYRAPSRAATEIGRGFGTLRMSPREYGRDQPLPSREDPRAPSSQSNLPVRRHYFTSGTASSLPPPSSLPSLGGRRYLDRTTPERDSGSVIGRLAEERGQRQPQPSLQGYGLGRNASVASAISARRGNTNTNADTGTAVQAGGTYH
ncbi:MAG: hypothetical protein M1818_004600 [Claussenomyces sp. TS43310]|nr:MAG: hypothetical protein M1818_004600 [Claussenomyces sp. TS43310]